MKAVLLSIKSKYCELIASGKKTIEVRKTKPKLKPPFKCYIYQTKDKQYCTELRAIKELDHALSIEENVGKVIGEFICDKITKFSIDEKIDNIGFSLMSKQACVSNRAIQDYAGDKYYLYGWHISNLIIYDVPKELSEFYKTDYLPFEDSPRLKRPPQSWCYVYKL